MQYDIIVCSSGPITIGLPGVFAKIFRSKKKFVFEVRDLWPDGAIQLGLIKNGALIKFAYYFEKLCYDKADLIVTCSKGMTDSIQNRFNKTNLLTIPNADAWTVIITKQTNVTSPAAYKQAQDVVRVTAKTANLGFSVETFTSLFGDVTNNI